MITIKKSLFIILSIMMVNCSDHFDKITKEEVRYRIESLKRAGNMASEDLSKHDSLSKRRRNFKYQF